MAGDAGPGLMFQEPALFPWLTVGANVEVPLKLRGLPAGRAQARGWPSCCDAVHLAEFAASAGRTSSPAACGSGSRWPARSPWTPRCC